MVLDLNPETSALIVGMLGGGEVTPLSASHNVTAQCPLSVFPCDILHHSNVFLNRMQSRLGRKWLNIPQSLTAYVHGVDRSPSTPKP